MKYEIKAPCLDCGVRELWEGAEFESDEIIDGLLCLFTDQSHPTFANCRHPHRWVQEVAQGELSEDDIELMEALLRMKGKDPADYMLTGNLRSVKSEGEDQ